MFFKKLAHVWYNGVMVTATKLRRMIYGFFVAIFALTVVFARPVLALTDAQRLQFSRNNILFYDPDENGNDRCIEASSVRGNSNGGDVYMIGDSITMEDQALLREALPNIVINANYGIWFAKNSPPDDYEMRGGVARIAEMGDQDVLVFAVGTNGGISDADIDLLMDALSGRSIHVILMTVYRGNVADSLGSNEIVKKLANEYENITYMDWFDVVSEDPGRYLRQDKIHPNDEVGRPAFTELVKNAVNEVSVVGIQTSSGTNDYSKVLSAKNAEHSVFNVPRNDPWWAGWGDGDAAAMKRVLENYGDLAYQLGDAVGAPWVAIIVQMRYEDSASACGRNNFWGNGCPTNTPVGGASIQGDNLGEGFAQYGQTLTNGWYDQALGITDPIEYLETIGPMWVQGDPNGPGYAHIDGMRNSARSLLAFIETEEGQAVVSQFGNYHGTTGTTRTASQICTVDRGTYTTGGVTISECNVSVNSSFTCAFPIDGATKENYLSNTNEHPSVLSSPINGWYHHDYPAVDLGIYRKMVVGKDFDIGDFPNWALPYYDEAYLSQCSSAFGIEHCNSSTGAAVVAITDGYVTSYNHYRGTSDRPLINDDPEVCAALSFKSTVGEQRTYSYVHLGYEEEYASRVNTPVKAGDIIGHIGLSTCAQYTQAHLHFENGDATVKTLISELYNSLPENAAELERRNDEAIKGGDSDVTPVRPVDNGASSADISCDSRTIDLGIEDEAYFNGERTSIRLCSIPNINQPGSSTGHAIVNSRVSGAYYTLAERYREQTGQVLSASESFRTMERQQYFYDCYTNPAKTCNNKNVAAAPGYSNHQGGLAIDFNVGGWDSAISKFFYDNLMDFGLDRKVSSEPWHVSPSGN